MNGSGPLVVPIVVDAFVGNTASRNPSSPPGFDFQRWLMGYDFLQDFDSAWPNSLSAGYPINFFTADVASPAAYNGVYIKWRLPAALTHAVGTAGGAEFPPVPNRWLVVRYANASNPPVRQATAWIVMSDVTNTASGDTTIATMPYDQVGSQYPYVASPAAYPVQVMIGVNVPLDGPWSEPSPGAPIALTAVAPGNPAFAVFQPFCNNVFSFFDLAYDLPSQVMSYSVVGWYSNGADDALAGAGSPQEFDALLAQLGWTIADWKPSDSPDAPTATWSVYSGFVTNVDWLQTSPPPTDVPASPATTSSDRIAVAFANSTVSAVSSVITGDAAADPDLDPALLEAFQLNLLSAFDQPGGAGVVANAVEAAGFRKVAGGPAWQLLANDGTRAEQQEASRLFDVLTLLQAAANAEQQQLQDLQDQLYVAWWTWGLMTANYQVPPAALTKTLDPQTAGSLAEQVVAQQQTIIQFETDLIAAAAVLQAIPGVNLQLVAMPLYYVPSDPVVLLAGAGVSGISANASSGPLVCRFASQLVTAIVCDGVEVVANPAALQCNTPYTAPAGAFVATAPLPAALCQVTGAPWDADLIVALLNEPFLLDPDNAATIAASLPSGANLTAAQIQSTIDGLPSNPQNAIGVLPAGYESAPPTQQWSQNPWSPLMLYWEGFFTPIAPFDGETFNWNFNGSGYDWSGNGADTSAQRTLSGLIVLSPGASLNLAAQIQSYLASMKGQSPGSPVEAELTGLSELLAVLQNSDLLSQALDGFNQQLLGNQNGAFPAPGSTGGPTYSPSLESLIGSAAGYPPSKNAASQFVPWRAGQFQFLQLYLTDEWGQTLFLIDYLDPQGTFPSSPDFGAGLESLILIPPGLLQPARLLFTPLAAGTGDEPALQSNPIDGWIVPNLLDQSLLVYLPSGELIGELATTADGASVVWLSPESGSPVSSPPAVSGDPFMTFIDTLLAGSGAAFQAFFAAVDAAASSIAPNDASYNQNLTLMLGRPLAFVRALLELQLDGAPMQPPVYPSAPIEPAVVATIPFGVALGGNGELLDGLAGYFLGSDYATFYAVAPPSNGSGVVTPIEGNWFSLSFGGVTAPQSIEVAMLLDPRVPVHATTGILPVQSAQVAPAYVQSALDAMDVVFRVDAIVADADAPATSASPSSPGSPGSPWSPRSPGSPAEANVTVRMPLPWKGQWAWSEALADGAAHYPAAAAVTNARLSSSLPVVRRGLLRSVAPFRSSP